MPLWMALSVQAVAFAPVWRWYGARLCDGSEEPYGALALVTALVAIRLEAGGGRLEGRALLWAAGFGVAYAVVAPGSSALVRAVLAAGAVACVVARGRLAIVGLLALSLPVVASLQFYAGWPVRLITAQLAAGVLSVAGWGVDAVGTCLAWRGDLVSVDAPCAGIKMLWTGLYLNFALAAFGGLDARRTLVGWSATSALVFAGNLLRTVLLFFVETRIVAAPAGAHAGVGLAVFALVAAGVVAVHGYLQRRPACAS